MLLPARCHKNFQEVYAVIRTRCLTWICSRILLVLDVDVKGFGLFGFMLDGVLVGM